MLSALQMVVLPAASTFARNPPCAKEPAASEACRTPALAADLRARVSRPAIFGVNRTEQLRLCWRS